MTDQALAAPLVDTHCHLVLLDERGLLDAAFESAAAAGVTQIVSVGLNVEDSDRNRVIAEAHDNVWYTVGWHPHEPLAPDAAQLRALDELLRHPRAVAVGERDYVVETDSPFLAPVPHRGRANLPGYVAATARALARLRQVGENEARTQSTATARRLFNLPGPAT